MLASANPASRFPGCLCSSQTPPRPSLKGKGAARAPNRVPSPSGAGLSLSHPGCRAAGIEGSPTVLESPQQPSTPPFGCWGVGWARQQELPDPFQEADRGLHLGPWRGRWAWPRQVGPLGAAKRAVGQKAAEPAAGMWAGQRGFQEAFPGAGGRGRRRASLLARFC